MTALDLSNAGAPPVLVVGSGKGGVGKSLIAIMLAAAAARAGRRTLLVDGDHNLAKLHVLLGLPPAAHLVQLLDEACDPPRVRPVWDGLWLFAGESGDDALQGLDPLARARLQHRVTSLFPGYDFVVVDAPAGLDGVTRCTGVGAAGLVVVTVPEEPALADAGAVVRTVQHAVPGLPMEVIVNRTVAPREGPEAYGRLQAIAAERLGRAVRYAGAIPDDPGLRAMLRSPDWPNAGATGSLALRTMDAIARGLVIRWAGSALPAG